MTAASREGAGRELSAVLVTGAYYPEISAAGVQCRAVAAALRGRVRFHVVTTAVDRGLAPDESVDGVEVHRVHVDVGSVWSKATASARMLARLARLVRQADLVHVHGFSQKNLPVALVSRLAGKPLVMTLHTAGQDEPQVVARRGRVAYRAFTAADLVMSVSPHLTAAWAAAGLDTNRVRLVPNGIDTERFHPVEAAARRALRRQLGLPADLPVVLFVGFFSRDKRPDLAVGAWIEAVRRSGHPCALVMVGARAPRYYEIDRALGDEIERAAAAAGAADHLHFVEPTNAVEQYFQAADVFVLASAREAHPVALLEAMACGLPIVASRLPGATDVIVADGVNGLLVEVDDRAALAGALVRLLADPDAARAMGARARKTIVSRYDIRQTADGWLAAYRHVLS